MAFSSTAKVRTCLWFNGRGEEAAEFYVSLLPGSEITARFHPRPDAPAMVVEFTLAGTPYQILDAGAEYALSPAVSISVPTPSQQETDRLWTALSADGGLENRCGWLTDRFGLSWQIFPAALPQMLMGTDKAGAARTMQAMMGMVKIDLAALEAAYNGK